MSPHRAWLLAATSMIPACAPAAAPTDAPVATTTAQPTSIASAALPPDAGERPPPAALDAEDVGPRCRPTSSDSGSVKLPPLTHAQTFSGRQSFACEGGGSVTLYSYDFETPEQAKKSAEVLGAGLWKGPRPTTEHPDELLIRGSVVVLVPGHQNGRFLGSVLEGKGFSPAHPGPEAPSEAELAGMMKRLSCSKPRNAAYCEALTAFAKAAPAGPSIGPLVGRALDVQGSASIESTRILHVDDGRGACRAIFHPDFKEEGRILARLAAKGLPADDPTAARARAQRIDRDASKARPIAGSMVILDEDPIFVREAAGTFIAVRSTPGFERFEVGIFKR